MIPRSWIGRALGAVGLLLVAACNGGATAHISGTGAAAVDQPSATATATPGADGVQQVVIDATDGKRFRPDLVEARPGRLRITIRNTSVLPANFAIVALGVHSQTIFSGSSSTVTVDAASPGSYQFVCTFHQHDGMVGQLVIG